MKFFRSKIKEALSTLEKSIERTSFDNWVICKLTGARCKPIGALLFM